MAFQRSSPGPGGVGPTSSGWPEGNFCLRSKTRGVIVALQSATVLLQSPPLQYRYSTSLI
ncbi:unnamed protein product [Prunus armeniaca]